MAVVVDPVIYPDDPPQLPSCCAVRPARASGALILGGSARVVEPSFPVRARGGLVLGGAAMVTQPSTYAGVGAGGLILGGRGVGVHFPPAVGAGGLVLGGVGVGTGPQPSPGPSGSGGEETFGCDACPDGAAFTYVVHLSGLANGSCSECGGMNGDLFFSFARDCNWVGGRLTQCGAATGATGLTIGPSVVTLGLPWATYQGARGGWNCLSPLTLALSFGSPVCSWPATVTLEPAA